jgi:hypothetical protein
MKNIGGNIYIHYTALHQLPLDIQNIIKIALRCIPINYDYQIIKYNRQTRSVSFIKSPDWDMSPEPIVGDCLLVKSDMTMKLIRGRDQIYHHKWMFVDKDYTGFNIEQSKARSKMLEPIIRDNSSRIGYQKFWKKLLTDNNIV